MKVDQTDVIVLTDIYRCITAVIVASKALSSVTMFFLSVSFFMFTCSQAIGEMFVCDSLLMSGFIIKRSPYDLPGYISSVPKSSALLNRSLQNSRT